MTTPSLTIGLLVNPLAGIGGAVGLKGSDGAEIVARALALGAQPLAAEKTKAALSGLVGLNIEIITCPGSMGEDICKGLGLDHHLIAMDMPAQTNSEQTRVATELFKQQNLDLLLFAGGDGTARDICAVIASDLPCLGIPAGVKIHSGVFAITPKAAGELVKAMAQGRVLPLEQHEVRDIDEQAFRQNRVSTRYFGEMLVPQLDNLVQQVKGAGIAPEVLAIDDIAAGIVERMQADCCYIVGSGSTAGAVMSQLGLENTLLGIDVVKNGESLLIDANEKQLLELVMEQPAKLILGVIGQQGHILGRGNHQLSPAVLRRVGRDNIILAATPHKLAQLSGRPLLIDLYDAQLVKALSGVLPVWTGYEQQVLYPVHDGLASRG